jgi:hypothetical protein
MNMYAYVGNDPVSFIDPSGMGCKDVQVYMGTVLVPPRPGSAEDVKEGIAGTVTSVYTTQQVCWDEPTRGRAQPGGGNGGGGSGGGTTQPNQNPCFNPPALPGGDTVDSNIKFAKELKRNALVRAGSMSPMNFSGAYIVFLPLNLFYNQVHNKGPWDYKQAGSQYEYAGNFNYGATGAAMEISEQTLLRGAGLAQQVAGTSLSQWNGPLGAAPYGDDPKDAAAIRDGIAYFKRCRR